MESNERILQRQTRAAFDTLTQQGNDVTLRVFEAADGADAHCQVNNLRLAHATVFDWLDDRCHQQAR